MVKVYTRDGCQRCRLTERRLDRDGVDYEAVDVDSTPGVIDHLLSMGFREMPVVDPTGSDDVKGMWSGFRPDRLSAIAG